MPHKKKINLFIIVGELSGDQIASNIIIELKKKYDLNLYGLGGKNLKSLGLKSIFPINELSIMGILEIIPRIPKLLKLIIFTVNEIRKFNPDLVISVDAPGFSFRVLKKLKQKNNYKTLHIVAPTVWAWKSKRAKKISSYVDYLFVLFSFEKKYFTPHGLKTFFIGHPLSHKNISERNIKRKKNISFFNDNKKIVSIFPGSRKKEIKTHLDKILLYLSNFSKIREFNILIVAVEEHYNLIKPIAYNYNSILNLNITTSKNKAIVFNNSFFAVAVSGTITLELALAKLPFFTIYKLNSISFFILKKLVYIKYICLINIIFNKKIVNELIQNDFNQKNMLLNIDLMLKKEFYDKQIKNFKKVPNILKYNNKNPSKLAANIIKNKIIR